MIARREEKMAKMRKQFNAMLKNQEQKSEKLHEKIEAENKREEKAKKH